MRSFSVVVFLLTAISGMHGCGEDEGSSPFTDNMETSQSTGVADAQADSSGAVSHERALNATDDVENWLLHGRTYDEQRFSPLVENVFDHEYIDNMIAFAGSDHAYGNMVMPRWFGVKVGVNY